MNNTLEELFSRKSVRAYEERPIEPEKQKLILQAATQAPTAGNMMMYSILNITDQSVKEQLAHLCDDQPFIAKAPMVLVFVADYQKWYDSFCLMSENPRQPQWGDFSSACADTYIAAQNAVVAAWSMGIGSCYIGDIKEHYEQQRELLNLPQYTAPICMLCFGYPTKQQQERKKPARFALEDVVFENQYRRLNEQELKDMYYRREQAMGKTDIDVPKMVDALMQRKWNSPYSRERNRSIAAMLENWK